MLGKLIKYEFKSMGRLMPITYIVVIALAVLGVVFSAMELYIYMILSFFLIFLSGSAAIIITYIIVIMRFHKGMFGKEGYLAMTLPASSTQLYLSKTIVSSIWLLAGTLIAFLAWGSAFYSLFRLMWLESGMPYYFLDELREIMSMVFPPGFIAFIIAFCIIGFLSFVAQIYFCMTISHIRPFQSMGIGAAVLCYIALQITTQVLNGVLSWIVPFGLAFDPYRGGWFLTNLTDFYSNPYLYSEFGFAAGITSYVFPLLFAFVLPILTIYLIDRKVNLK